MSRQITCSYFATAMRSLLPRPLLFQVNTISQTAAPQCRGHPSRPDTTAQIQKNNYIHTITVLVWYIRSAENARSTTMSWLQPCACMYMRGPVEACRCACDRPRDSCTGVSSASSWLPLHRPCS
eukprot:232311-Chlamydomonas_euryale.AAC.1